MPIPEVLTCYKALYPDIPTATSNPNLIPGFPLPRSLATLVPLVGLPPTSVVAKSKGYLLAHNSDVNRCRPRLPSPLVTPPRPQRCRPRWSGVRGRPPHGGTAFVFTMPPACQRGPPPLRRANPKYPPPMPLAKLGATGACKALRAGWWSGRAWALACRPHRSGGRARLESHFQKVSST